MEDSKITFILFLTVISLIGCNKAAEGEIHLIPEDFRGKVYIVYNQRDGTPAKYDADGNRVFHIPKSGILKTQMQRNEGYYYRKSMRFYSINPIGQVTRKLKYYSSFSKKDSLEKAVMMDSLTVNNLYRAQRINITDSLNENTLSVAYLSYVVSKYDDKKTYPKLKIEDLE